MAWFPKMIVHRMIEMHPFHHTSHDWVERHKKKRVILEELVELKPDLRFMNNNGSVDNEVWRAWKRDHKVSSGTYNMLFYLLGN